MIFLPVVEREMRTLARQPRCWWRRLLVAAFAMLILGFVMVVASAYQPPSSLGRDIFAGLAGATMIYGLLAGPLTTVDALSSERREGTLGLLYLTRLRGYDIVLGKMAAASLDLLLGLAAVLPIAAVPMLLGGVSLATLGSAGCAAFNLAFLSLAAGICASAFCQSGRAALGLTLTFLGILTLLVPWFLEAMFNLGPGHALAPFLLAVCPLYTMELVLGTGAAGWRFWVNMSATHALGWTLVGIACACAARAWRDLPETAVVRAWRRAVQRFSTRSSYRRNQHRRHLETNPVCWLESRQVLQGRLLWLALGVATLYWLFENLRSPRAWPNNDLVILWPMFAHYIFCLWVAIDAPRRLADDKHSGALELLLCTPLPSRVVVAGNMQALLRRFGPPFLLLLALSALGVLQYQARVNRIDKDLNWLAAVGAIVMVVQSYAMARVGLCQGLVSGNSLRATLTLAWKLGALPWLFFFGGLFCLDWLRRTVRPMRFPDVEIIVGLWGIAHLVLCAYYLRRANKLLNRDFRILAGPTMKRPLFHRLLG